MAVKSFGETGPAILHLSGERDFEALRGRVSRDDYVLLPFTEDFGMALGAADLVVSRAGGGVWEIAAAGKPAILVPFPHATADHQLKNARYFDRDQGVLIVPDDQAETVVPELVESLLAEPERLTAMGKAMRALAKPDAADIIAEELIALAAA
jgi:UDP-N-acetylglucosamine--N-acetylmuramyl-(pentapeptide) pyrophosphoryl-undecaprenol N-acetylglucosamine transferase